MCSLTYLHNIKTTSIMKWTIEMEKEVIAETSNLEWAKKTAEMLYNENNGQNVVFVNRKIEWAECIGRYSYDGWKNM